MPAPTLLPHDMMLFKRLKGGIDAADRGFVEAQASVTRASLGIQAAHAAMNTFMEHIAEVYGLKPQDVVDAEGKVHLVDPGWAMEAAQAAQAQAAAPPVDPAAGVDPHPPQTEAATEAPAEEPPSAPVEEIRVTRVEEEEPQVLPVAVEPDPMLLKPTRPVRRARAH